MTVASKQASPVKQLSKKEAEAQEDLKQALATLNFYFDVKFQVSYADGILSAPSLLTKAGVEEISADSSINELVLIFKPND